MTMHKDYHPRGDKKTDCMYQEKKKKEDLPTLKIA